MKANIILRSFLKMTSENEDIDNWMREIHLLKGTNLQKRFMSESDDMEFFRFRDRHNLPQPKSRNYTSINKPVLRKTVMRCHVSKKCNCKEDTSDF